METLIAAALIVGIAYVMFKSGKQLGSRRGFGAGCRIRRRRSRSLDSTIIAGPGRFVRPGPGLFFSS